MVYLGGFRRFCRLSVPWLLYTSPSDKYESGLEGDENGYLGDDGRFLYHAWHSADAGSPVLYELVLAKRMPHAVDLRQLELAWAFLKKFSRQKDGSLKISE